MEMFVEDGEIERLEASLPSQTGLDELRTLVTIAWHLRQRDTQRALHLSERAYQFLVHCNLSSREIATYTARLRLVRAEAQWLLSEISSAEALIARALYKFQWLDNHTGLADTFWLRGWIAFKHGNAERRDQEWDCALSAARDANDKLRIAIIETGQARFAAMHHLPTALERWQIVLRTALPDAETPVASAIHDFFGITASLSGDFGRSAASFIQAYELALKSGQIHAAIVAASNVADSFNHLNDYQAALNWGQRGLDLARSTGWAGSIGSSMMQLAEPLRRLKQFDAAQQMLQDALATLKPLPHSIDWAVALGYLGNLALDKGDFAVALDYFQQYQERANAMNQTNCQIAARLGLARAWSGLNQPEKALDMAHQALLQANRQQSTSQQIDQLQLLAEIHARHCLPAPPEAVGRNASLYYLQHARTMAESIDGYTVPSELLDALANAYADSGEYATAYRISLEANAAREKTNSQAANNLAIAVQVQQQTERALAEGEYHRQLAASEARRAEVLHQTSNTLLHLSAIGREITTELNQTAVLEILNQHVHSLLDVTAFSVYLMDANGQQLHTALLIEGGKILPQHITQLQHPTSNIARCVREKREISVQWEPNEVTSATLPGTMSSLCALYAPLTIGERVLGAMTIQSTRPDVYGERERLIFRTLCAYGAIALDNAHAYQQLQTALDALRQTEKKLLIEEKRAQQHTKELAQANLNLQENAIQLDLAKQKAEQATRLKSEFLANMSHEIRTPMSAVIGLAHLALRTRLDQKQQDYLNKIHHAGLRLMKILNDILDFSKIEACKLEIEHISFNLDEVLRHVADVTSQKAAEKGLEYLFQVNSATPRQLLGDPLRLGQILINLINNAIKFSDVGEVELSCASQTKASQVTLDFSVRDTGIGMSEEQCQRMFQSFSQADTTTSRKYGGTGLGLSISQHLAHLMGGNISVDSHQGQGSRFHFSLSFDLPQQQPEPPPLPDTLLQGRILVLDEHPTARSTLISQLKSLSLRAAAVTNAEQASTALHSAETAQIPYSVFLLANPEKHSALIHNLQATLRHPPHIITLSLAGQEPESVHSHLHKPVILSNLRTVLQKLYAPPGPDSGDIEPSPVMSLQRRILVVEDNDINQQIALELLTQQNIRVDIAQDGQEALDKLYGADPQTYQLIFMDLEMPEMDGHTAAVLIRQDHQYDTIPIIAMTAHALTEIQQQCLAEGMQDFISKPINPQLLANMIAHWLPNMEH
jgi:signal transduction histidine kinase/CheY-like chemotaxis protein